MDVGTRLKQFRELKGLSQGQIEKRTGLPRCYLSRVENGHTVPTLKTLEKFACALEVALYQLFYEGDKPLKSVKTQVHEIDVRFTARRHLFGRKAEVVLRLRQRRAIF
jgi:transcriptional regulator with XRE-family HTH domain